MLRRKSSISASNVAFIVGLQANHKCNKETQLIVQRSQAYWHKNFVTKFSI